MLSFYLSLLDTEEEKSKFERVYLCHRGMMVLAARDMLGSELEAEDMVHEAFIRVAQNLDRIDIAESGRTKSYVCSITRNLIKDRQRKEKNYRVVSMELVPEIAAETEDMLARMAAQEILSCIREIPTIYQDVLELKAIQDMSDKNIARTLHISQPATRKRLERARVLLKRKMDERNESHVCR